jgi:hypothetical protein
MHIVAHISCFEKEGIASRCRAEDKLDLSQYQLSRQGERKNAFLEGKSVSIASSTNLVQIAHQILFKLFFIIIVVFGFCTMWYGTALRWLGGPPNPNPKPTPRQDISLLDHYNAIAFSTNEVLLKKREDISILTICLQ